MAVHQWPWGSIGSAHSLFRSLGGRALRVGLLVLQGLLFGNCHFGRIWWPWKGWFWIKFTLGGCDAVVRTAFGYFSLWEDVIVLKWLIWHNFYFGMIWWSWKDWYSTMSILGGCGGLERTVFKTVLLLPTQLMQKGCAIIISVGIIIFSVQHSSSHGQSHWVHMLHIY